MKTQVIDHAALSQALESNPLQPKTIRAVVSHSYDEHTRGITGVRIIFTDDSAITLKVGGTASNGQPALLVEYEDSVHSQD